MSVCVLFCDDMYSIRQGVWIMGTEGQWTFASRKLCQYRISKTYLKLKLREIFPHYKVLLFCQQALFQNFIQNTSLCKMPKDLITRWHGRNFIYLGFQGLSYHNSSSDRLMWHDSNEELSDHPSKTSWWAMGEPGSKHYFKYDTIPI